MGTCAGVYAQDAPGNKDAKYLAGAVPEVDGKVVFAKEYSIPGIQKDEIYTRVLGWMEARLKKNENNSRVVYTNEEDGQIVGMGDEWIVFSSTALSLDRTRILYQLTATCQAEKCRLEISKIRFIYREGEERYTETTVADNAPIVIVPKKQVVEAPVQAPADKGGEAYREVAPSQLPADAIQTGTGKLVVVIGTDPFNMTMMTANAGGSIGKMEGKPVVFTILSPDQPYEQLENAVAYTVRFYPNGQDEPSLVLECKKMPSPAAIEGMPRTYVGEIVKATVK